MKRRRVAWSSGPFPPKRALRAILPIAAVWPAVLTAACALAPTHRSVVSHGGSAPAPPDAGTPAPPAHVVDLPLLGKNLDNIRRQPHLTTLPVPGYPNAVVAAPFVDDAAKARPVVIALHGLGDRPEPHCEAWRTITAAQAFVLCPRGSYDRERSTTDSPRYTHPGGEALRTHIDAALASLTARYGPAVDTAHPLLTGFSLGATEAALLAQADAERFPRVAVLEGGLDVWIRETIAAYTSQGGRRVLFGCGSPWCTPSATAAAERIDRAGVGAHVAFADIGHRPAPELQAAVGKELEWFLEGDDRWGRPGHR